MASIHKPNPTQRQQIVEYMKKHGSITRLESSCELFIFEMPARICELQKLGWVFKKDWITKKNKYGISKTFVRYSILKEGTII